MAGTRDLAKLEAWVYARLDSNISAVERKILVNYKEALDAIRVELSKVYEKYAVNGALTHAEMTKYNRLMGLQQQLTGIREETLKKNDRLVEKIIVVSFVSSFFMHEWAIEQSIGVQLNWGLLNEKTIKAATEGSEWYALKKIALSDLRTKWASQIDRIITQGLIRGDSYPKMAKAVKEATDATAGRAMTIARTEGQRAAVMGQQDCISKARDDLDIDVEEIWDATLDNRTRPEHGALDGKAKDEEHDGWYVPGIGWVPGPMQSGVPEFDINCFPGSELVSVIGPIERAYRRLYRGKLYTIATDVGVRFSVTPNHPVLTDDGWVAAQFLEKGDCVVCGNFGQGMPLRDVDIQRAPTDIQQVFDSFALSGTRQRMFASGAQFHGDGIEGDVDIVFPTGALSNGYLSTLSHPRGELLFAGAPNATTGFGALNQFGFGTSLSTDGSMGRSGQCATLCGSGIPHSHEHGLTAIALSDSGFAQDADDDLATDREASRQLFDRFAGQMEFGKVTAIDVSDFSGHVFNLQTSDGIIVVHSGGKDNSIGVLTHNCRCRVRPQIKGYGPKVRRVRDEGVLDYETFKEWRTKHGLKKNIYGQEY